MKEKWKKEEKEKEKVKKWIEKKDREMAKKKPKDDVEGVFNQTDFEIYVKELVENTGFELDFEDHEEGDPSFFGEDDYK